MLRYLSRTLPPFSFHKITWGSIDYQKTLEIRDNVLRRPHGQSISDHDLTPEKQVDLYAIFSELNVIGTAYLTPKSSHTSQLKQLAIDPSFQRCGIGTKFVYFLEHEAQNHGFTWMYLEARVISRFFYEKLQYKVISEPFLYCDIPHLQMQKQLTSVY
jgi:ribosomal protein S18 acetylase RimI-like enzyme